MKGVMKTNKISLLLDAAFLLFLAYCTPTLKATVLPCFYDQTAPDHEGCEGDGSSLGDQSSGNEQLPSDSDYFSCDELPTEHTKPIRQRHKVITTVIGAAPTQDTMSNRKTPPTANCCNRCKLLCWQKGVPLALLSMTGYCAYCYPKQTQNCAVAPLIHLGKNEFVPMIICGACCSGLCCPEKCDSCLKKGCCCITICSCAYVCSPYH